jgi:hypothetical protein
MLLRVKLRRRRCHLLVLVLRWHDVDVHVLLRISKPTELHHLHPGWLLQVSTTTSGLLCWLWRRRDPLVGSHRTVLLVLLGRSTLTATD